MRLKPKGKKGETPVLDVEYHSLTYCTLTLRSNFPVRNEIYEIISEACPRINQLRQKLWEKQTREEAEVRFLDYGTNTAESVATVFGMVGLYVLGIVKKEKNLRINFKGLENFPEISKDFTKHIKSITLNMEQMSKDEIQTELKELSGEYDLEEIIRQKKSKNQKPKSKID